MNNRKHLTKAWPSGAWLGAALGIILAASVARAAAPMTSAATQSTKNPPQGVFEDHWYAVRINGQRSGYSRIATKREGDTIESLNFIEMSIQRGPAQIKMVLKSKQRETIDGKPLGFEADQQMSLMNVKMTGAVRDGRIYIKTTQQGRSTESDYAWDPRAKMSWGVCLATRAEPIEVGKTFDLWVYDATARPSGPVRTKTRITGKETITLPGGKVEAFKAETTTYLGVPVTSTSYVDEGGGELKMTMDLGFITAELVSCSEAYARQKTAPPELFVQTFVALGKSLDAESLRRVRYRLRIEDEVKPDMFPATTMQKVVERAGHEIVLDVRRIDESKLAGATLEPVPQDVKPYLQASTFLNAKDPVIVDLARKAVGKEKNPLKMADLLRRFVTEYVDRKDLTVGLATASEVARSKQGDCTEHAVLLAAVARAAGLPSRCVGGMVYVPSLAGRKHVFGFHMWTQVWIGGEWVDIDAALRQTDCDPSHIAMAIMPLNEEGLVDIAIGILPFIGKTRIEVVETEKMHN